MTGAAFAAPFLERRHMILVKNRELLFSNREQYIGTPYDNNSETRLFAIDRLQMGGVDIADLSFRLDLKYAKTNTSDTSLLDKQITDDKVYLTWTIVNSVLQVTGPVFVNIRATDSTGTVKWSSYQAVVYVEEVINTPGTYTGGLTELEQLEKRIEEKTETLDANEGERQANEIKRQQNTAAAITRADTASNRANTAAEGAEAAMERANTAAVGVEEATNRANVAASNTEQAITNATAAAAAANTAAGSVEAAKEAANTAATNANSKAKAADSAAIAANTAAGNANTKAQAANTAAQAANTAAANANSKAQAADSAATAATTAARAANTAASEVNTAKNNANTAADAANTAAGNADAKAQVANAAASTANKAAETANTAAKGANTQGNYAKTQGDYAKEQGDAAKIVAQGAVAQNGGDISNTVITTLDTIVGDFPAPTAGERGKTFFGKVKKFIDDFKALKASLVVVGQIINTFDQTAEGTVADGRALKTLKDLIDTNSTSISELIGQVLMASAISNVQVNATDKVPSSALVNIMQQAITKNANNIDKLNGDLDSIRFKTVLIPESEYLESEKLKLGLSDFNISIGNSVNYIVKVSGRFDAILIGNISASNNYSSQLLVSSGDILNYRFKTSGTWKDWQSLSKA